MSDTGNSLFTTEALNILQYFSVVVVLGIGLSLWQMHSRLWTKQALLLSVIINAAFAGTMIWLALYVPVLESASFTWSSFIDSDNFQTSFRITLLIIALFPAYESIRDIRRVRLLDDAASSLQASGKKE